MSEFQRGEALASELREADLMRALEKAIRQQREAEARSDILRRACIMAYEELEFGGDWKAARAAIKRALANATGEQP